MNKNKFSQFLALFLLSTPHTMGADLTIDDLFSVFSLNDPDHNFQKENRRPVSKNISALSSSPSSVTELKKGESLPVGADISDALGGLTCSSPSLFDPCVQYVPLPYEDIKMAATGKPSIWRQPSHPRAEQSDYNYKSAGQGQNYYDGPGVVGYVLPPFYPSYAYSHVPYVYPPMPVRPQWSVMSFPVSLHADYIHQGLVSVDGVRAVLSYGQIHEPFVGTPEEGGHGKVYFTQNYAVKVTNETGARENECAIFQQIAALFNQRSPQGVQFCLPPVCYDISFEGKRGYHSILVMPKLKPFLNLEESVEKALKKKNEGALKMIKSLGRQIGRFQTDSAVYDAKSQQYKVLVHQDLKIWNIIVTGKHEFPPFEYDFTFIDNASLEHNVPYVDTINFLWNSAVFFCLNELENKGDAPSISSTSHDNIKRFFVSFLTGYFKTINPHLNTAAAFLDLGKPYKEFRKERIYPFPFENNEVVVSTLNTLTFCAALQALGGIN